MASTYSPSLRIELIGAGDQAGTWNTTTNSNLGTIIESAIAGYVAVSVTSANQAFTALDGAADQARNAVIALTTTTGANFAVYAPPQEKTYVIYNTTAYIATVYNSTVLGNTTAAGLGVAVAAGGKVAMFSDGTNFRTTDAGSFSGILPVVNGGTGVATSTGTGNTVLSTSPTLTTPTMTAPVLGTPASGTLDNCTSNTETFGTSNTQLANTAFVQAAITAAVPSGVVVMWSGSVVSIPTGWLLCDGTSSTPDLRNRFIVGAGGLYAVAAVGGSENAVVVSHSHTASTTSTDSGHAHTSFSVFYTGSGDQNIAGDAYRGVISGTATSTASANITSSTTVASAGVSGTNANLPPYYALAYIMKS